MSKIRMRWLLVLAVLTFPGATEIWADEEWGPFSGGAMAGLSNCASDSIHVFGSYEFNYDDTDDSSGEEAPGGDTDAGEGDDAGTRSSKSTSPLSGDTGNSFAEETPDGVTGAGDEDDVGTLSARRRNGIDFELGYIELDVGGQEDDEQEDDEQEDMDETGIFSLGYVRIHRFGESGVKARYGGGLSFFAGDTTELGFHVKAELQIALRKEGNLGLMLGVVHYRPDSKRDFTAFRVGLRLHRRQKQ